MDLESGFGLAGCLSDLGVLRRQSRCCPELQSQLNTGLGEGVSPSLFTWRLVGLSASQTIGLSISVSHGQGPPLISQHMDFLTGLPQDMAASSIQCERSEITPKKLVTL